MIGAIIVTYNPDLPLLEKALNSLAPQVDELCVVDNSPTPCEPAFYASLHAHRIGMGGNRGIAAAQNAGIRHLIARGADHILFSDQDSVASAGLVECLLAHLRHLENTGVAVAAVGTRAINRSTNAPYKDTSKKIGTLLPASELAITEYYSVRSSISIIPAAAFAQVGDFDETLFIDGVDHEWCWRAWHKQSLRSFIIENARITHMLGESGQIGGKSISLSSPFRLYHQYRNYLWLARRDYVPRWWKTRNGVKYIIKLLYYPLFVPPRIRNLQNILRGIRDGIKRSETQTTDKQ